MKPTRMLYTRQQVSEVTGVDDQTLAYWIKEGLLVPAEGGGGKGQHKRFAFIQVNVALLLKQVKHFGASLSSLKSLADIFQSSLEWSARHGLTPLDVRAIYVAQDVREKFKKWGYYPADASQFPGMPVESHGPLSGNPRVHLYDWEAVQSYIIDVVEGPDALSPRHFELAEQMDPQEVAEHWRIIRIVGVLGRDSDRPFPHYFFRRDDGSWVIEATPAEAGKHGDAFIAIDMDRVIYRAWN